MLVKLDLNVSTFQKGLFSLEKEEQFLVLSTLKRISQFTWEQVYKDHGLRWEAIAAKQGPKGQRLYSFRISKKFRVLAFRDQEWLCLLSLHPDHDSAYK